MAQRYGGKYSAQPPDTQDPPANAFRGQTAARVPVAARLMYVLPLPLLLAAIFEIFSRDVAGIVVELGGFVLLMTAAVLLNQGITAQRAYEARKVARPPAFPRKLFAGFCAGAGVALAATSTGLSLGMIEAAFMGAMATGAHVLAFGLDPMRDKRMEGIDTFQQDRVAKVVDEAEAHLASMTDHIASIGDRKLDSRTAQFQAAARTMIRTVEEDPRDLTAARKYLGVYLRGASDATVKFADIYARTGDAQARTDYADLLDDLEQNFSARTRKMLLDDRSDLTVEIEVLRERLQREGVRPS